PEGEPTGSTAQVGVGANGQRPGVDHRASLVGVAASEDDLTRARLHERARYGNNATEGGSIGAIDSKATVATNVADGTTVADLQHSAAYDCRPGITIGTGQRQRAGSNFDQSAGSRDHSRERHAGVVVPGSERRRSQCHIAHACERPEGLIEPIEVEGST